MTTLNFGIYPVSDSISEMVQERDIVTMDD